MDKERIFVGPRMQRGYGLGGFFASLFRRALPLFKSGSRYLAKKAVKTGLNTLQDVARGENPRVALKRNISDVSDELLDEVKRKIRRKMTGQGAVDNKGRVLKRNNNNKQKKKKKKKEKKKSVNPSINKKCKDIFDE